MSKIFRRDFLKIGGAVLAGSFISEKAASLGFNIVEKSNIIIILCDALAARHLSAYGYPRLTTPNIDAFSESATVYHSHYSGGNFTTTGTASMLTGLYASKHRAINQGGLVSSDFVHYNPYSLLGSEYYRFAFSQNVWSDRLVGQYTGDVDRFLHPEAYSLLNKERMPSLFNRDRALASVVSDDFLFQAQANIPGSLLAGYLNKTKALATSEKMNHAFARYPDGPPAAMIEGYLSPYLNEDVYNGMYLEISRLSHHAPYFAYFHLFSPHFPYRPRRDYLRLFKDDYRPVSKPVHPLSSGLSDDYLLSRRTLYDRQIAQLDEEFGKLFSKLKEDGVLENSYVIFTSDHGELFERGFAGHGFQYMYEDVLHIPLIIHAPRQTTREDIYSLTSNVDLLPTLLTMAGKDVLLTELDGRILPGFGKENNSDRPIFSFFAVDNSAFAPIKKAVISMRKQNYKLIAYLNYDELEQPFELYDLETDAEELSNLALADTKTLAEMQIELFQYVDETNKLLYKNNK